MEGFLSALMLTLEDLDMFSGDLREIIESTRVQVGNAGSNCIVLIPLDSTEVHQNVQDTIETVLAIVNDTGLTINGGIGLGLTLKDLVKHVENVNLGQQKGSRGS